ncbi:glycosyltransferase family 2 protein [Chroococcidiopsis sp. TS-821]|uniref:glycosyltransferase n=1 Tax=Chroococcidiopsis sp. TS-821 TaxID=1378066 RepID=UPI000CEED522|nr:glycosyltransferase [Chroococcidiopsis sp. TS-821]PPS45650.1 glycosyl transferase family 2 [Chroococcidiopsis sp. TS-821]
MSYESKLFVSVIVPVFNDAKRLKLCLSALEKQTYPQTLYEVIVVDNASDPEQNIASVVAQFKQTKTVYERSPGSYAARNKGISHAQGEVIAFTDADCIPAPNWIENGVRNLVGTPNCGLVAGKIEIFFKNPQRLTAVELYESIMALPQREFLEKHHYGATANVFTWKSVIEQVGVFDASLKSSGDVEWGQRVAKYGYKQVYAEDTCVAHPARSSWRELYKRSIRHAGGFYDLQVKTSKTFWERNHKFFVSLFQDLTPPLNFTLNVFLDSRLENFTQKAKVSSVMFFIRYVSAWEKMRLKFGGDSARE